MDATKVSEILEKVKNQVSKVLVAMEDKVELLFAALLARGHVLIEGVPGVAKTSLAKAFAEALGLEFKRIQFTPDMLPSDVTGAFIFDEKRGEFVFRPGPVFANIVLADEINRASPRTQSALLEAMQERQVTVEGHTFPLPEPFMVIATLNPVETVGVFPLPEAQLDRFTLRVIVGVPSRKVIVDMLERVREILEWRIERVVEPKEVMNAVNQVLLVTVSRDVNEYIALIVEETHHHPAVRLGASPRAALTLNLVARAWALMHGRDFVVPEDVKAVAKPVLAHRLILKPEARAAGVTGEKVVEDVLKSVDLKSLEKR